MSGSVGSFNPHALRAIGAGASPDPASKLELATRRVREQHDMAVKAAKELSTLSMMFPGRVGGDLALSNGNAADLAEIVASRLTAIEECAQSWPDIETSTKLALAGAASRLGGQSKCGVHDGSSMHDAVNTALRATSTLWGAVKPAERHAIALTNIQSHIRAGWCLLGDQLPDFDFESVRISLEREAADAIGFLTEPSKQTALPVPVITNEEGDPRHAVSTELSLPKPPQASREKLFPNGVPEDQNLVDCIVLLDSNRDGVQADMVWLLEFFENDERKAELMQAEITRARSEGVTTLPKNPKRLRRS